MCFFAISKKPINMKSEYFWDLAVKYLTKSASKKEISTFESWLSASQKNARQFEEIKKYWDASFNAFKNYNPDIEKAWQDLRHKTMNLQIKEKSRKVYFLRNLSKIAAVIILIIGLGFLIKLTVDKSKSINNQLVTYISNEDIKKVELDDGSIVWLNRYSELKVADFSQKRRRVMLEGEAFFEVQEDPRKPFLIKTNNTITKVLGTSFNIKELENEIIVTVSSGKVLFYKSNKKRNKIILAAGDQGVFNISTKKINAETNKNNNFLAWKTGIITFKNTSLIDICKQLSEIYNKNIIIPDTTFSDYTLTGNFNNAPLDEILEVIELTLDVKFIEVGENIEIHN